MAVTDQPGAEVSPQALFSALQGGRVPAELKGTSLAFELGDAPALSDAELDAFARSSGAGDGGGGAHRAQLALAELRHTIERRTRDAAARSATPFREAAEKLQRDLADEKVCDALSCYYY